MNLPVFRYHPDPIGSGSIAVSPHRCRCCERNRGYICAAPVYAETDLDEALCPWCISDGSAHQKFDATFVDSNAFPDAVPESVVTEISARTPGFDTWQPEQWPACCDDATAFLFSAGIAEIRAQHRELEGAIMRHIVHELEISGGAATRLLESLHRERGPTLHVFRCLTCRRHHFHVDCP